MSDTKYPKLSVNLSYLTAANLEFLMSETGANATDVTNMAIQTLTFIYSQEVVQKRKIKAHWRNGWDKWSETIKFNWKYLTPRNKEPE